MEVSPLILDLILPRLLLLHHAAQKITQATNYPYNNSKQGGRPKLTPTS
jgi:hypothetical protein